MGLILLRYGELALKGGNRKFFIRRLRRNVRRCLEAHDIPAEVSSRQLRTFVRTDRVQEALEPLCRVFGITSLSPVSEVPRELSAIVEESLRQAQAAGVGPERSFRVDTRRVDKRFEHTSIEVNERVGRAIVDATQAPVDLGDPEVTIGIEIRQRATYVYSQKLPAQGGLPVGVEGRVVALISGGIDSPVAAWRMMKRGCSVIPVHLSHSAVDTEKALQNVEQLQCYSYGWDLRPIILEHGHLVEPILRQLRELGLERWSCLFCKRAMLRKACRIADEYHAQAVILGDSLGQVASQSLHNLEIISYGMSKPILRPLIGMDKLEIISLAKEIGTYSISTRERVTCPYLPAHPITRAKMDQFLAVLQRLEQAGGNPP